MPYRIAKDLIDNTVKCVQSVDTNHLKVDCFEEHLDEIHHGEMNVDIEKSLEIYFSSWAKT